MALKLASRKLVIIFWSWLSQGSVLYQCFLVCSVLFIRGTASPVLSTGQSLPWSSWRHCCDTGQDVICFLGHLATLWFRVSCCWQNLPGPFPLGSFPGILPQASSAAWGCCDQRAGLNTLFYWTSYNFPWPISPASPDPSADLACPPADQHSHPSWLSSANWLKAHSIPCLNHW